MLHNELEAAIDWLFAIEDNGNIPETALLFFAGHGLRYVKGRRSEGFLATSRANPTAANTEKWGVSFVKLRQILECSPVKQQIVILDCCHSGEVFNYKEAYQEVDPGKSDIVTRCLMSACGASQAAFEPREGQHSYFTETLLQGLQQPGLVSTITLSAYVRENFKHKLPAAVRNQHHPDNQQDSQQDPDCRNRNGEIILIDPEVEPIKYQEIVEGLCPYKGLAAFQEEDAPYFFGRSNLTQELVNLIHDSSFLAVLGISGSGKSSVVRAGLIPELKQGSTFSETRKWKIYQPFKPGDDPLANLARVLADENLSMEQVNAELAQGSPGLQRLISQVNASGDVSGVVLVVDQFEQIFTQCQSHAQRQQFFDCLFGAINSYSPLSNAIGWGGFPNSYSPLSNAIGWGGFPIHIIITMRADFLGKCAEYPQLAKAIETSNKIVGPMEEAELREAISKPGKKFNWEIPDNLQNRMIADVQKSPGSLPLLQYVLTELWKWRGQRLTLDTYDNMGGVQKALQTHAEKVYKSLSPEQQTIAKNIFLELTQLVGTEPTSRQVRKSRLLGLPPAPEQVETVLNELVEEKARLLAIGKLSATEKNADDIEVVEVIHESLISNWERLKQWVEENPDIKRQKDEIQDKAEEWSDKGKRREGLLRGLDLVEAEAFVRRYGDEVPLLAPAPEFLRKSIWHRRITSMVAIGTVATVLTVVTGLWLNAQRQATIASLGEKAARSQNLLTSQPVDGLVLAIQVAGESQDKLGQVLSPVQDSLLNAIQLAKERNLFTGHQTFISSVAFSPDGNYIISGSQDKTIRLWDINGNLLEEPFRGHKDWVTSVAFSPNGNYIVSAGGMLENTVNIWDIKKKQIVNSFYLHNGGGVNAVAFSPDGKYIVIGSGHVVINPDKDTVRLWNIQTRQFVNFIDANTGGVTSVAFSPDSQYIATGSWDNMVRLWNINGEQIGNFFKGHESVVTSVVFSPDGKMIVSGSGDGTVRVWDLKGNLIQKIRVNQDGISSVAFTQDGKNIIIGDNKILKIYNISTNQVNTINGNTDLITAIAISPSNHYILNGDTTGNLRLFEIRDDRIGQPFIGHSMPVTSVAIDEKNKLIVSSGDRTIRLWDLNGNLVMEQFLHPGDDLGAISCMAISPKTNYIVSCYKNKLQLWDMKGNKIGEYFKGHQNDVTSVAISSDAKYIISSSFDNTIRRWSLDGETIGKPFTCHKNGAQSLAISPNDKYIFSSGYDRTVCLWDWHGNLIEKWSIKDEGLVRSVAFSSNGHYLVTGHENSTSKTLNNAVRLWDLKGNLLAHPFQGHEGTVSSVMFSPDSQYIVSGSHDGTIRLWDLYGTPIGQPFRVNKGGIFALSISSDGQYIVSGGDDKTVRLWRLGNWKNWLQMGCNQLQYHPVLVAPETDVAREAGETCQKYAWNHTQSVQFLVRQGKALAREEDIEGAVAKFKQAKRLDATLDLEPEAEAKRIAVPALVEAGKDLAGQGEYNEAVAKFQQALTLDPTLDLEPEAEAKRLAVPALVQKAENRVKDKKYKEALETYIEAQKIDSTLEISAQTWTEICWYGSLRGEAAAVLEACDKAVTLDPEYVGNRGVAKAIAGDKDGAIKDFQAYIELSNNQEANKLLQDYINALRAGENPFTDAEIKQLLGSDEFRPYLGIEMISLTSELVEDINNDPQIYIRLTTDWGILIARVIPNTPADLGGLRAGDVIQKVNNRIIFDSKTLQEIIQASRIGSQLELEINREGQTIKLGVSIGNLPIIPPRLSI